MIQKEAFILYDSLFNTVFQGQVASLLTKRLDAGDCAQAFIISFEQRTVLKEELEKLVPDKRITIIVLKKTPFLGTLSLYYAAHQLRKVFRTISFDNVIARGPLASWIACKAMPKTIPIRIQARGLAAEEYRYVHKTTLWHRFRAQQYDTIERTVYQKCAQKKNVNIEVVSKALKEYLIKKWDAPENKITIAAQDIPVSCAVPIIKQWRSTIRNALSIPLDAFVYVYAGSAHPWQCPEKTIQFFAEKRAANQAALLLILTAQQEPFKRLLTVAGIPSKAYRLATIPHEKMYAYLASADAGLLFRKKHIINWVSRPTKALEYQAVGLPIIHNDTVEMLTSVQNPSTSSGRTE